MSRSYTTKDILNHLDDCVMENPLWTFMDLEHGYFYTANSRLSLFASDTQWAIVFEMSGFANRSCAILLELNYFGNCLINLETGGENNAYTYNAKHFELVNRAALKEIESGFEQVSSTATHVKLRGESVAISNTNRGFERWIPDMLDRDHDDKITFADLGRYLAFEYEKECRATVEELRSCLPDESSLPFIGCIDQWYHEEYNNYLDDDEPWGEPPSSYETFPLIAEVLVSGDMGKFQPMLSPCNHWRHWPEAGEL